uniref:Uncharacterized protein n=1 Tax=Arundo donax TaxID=35708 RepID=A0A0A8YDN5_ARUDO
MLIFRRMNLKDSVLNCFDRESFDLVPQLFHLLRCWSGSRTGHGVFVLISEH